MKIKKIKLINFFIGIVISIFFGYFVFVKINFGDALNSFLSANPSFYFLASLFIFVAYFFKSLRVGIMSKRHINNNHQLYSMSYFFIGNALNNFLPARGGDIYRLIMYSKKTNYKYSTVLSFIAYERFLDFFCLLIIISMSFLFIGENIFNNFFLDFIFTNKLSYFFFIAIVLLVFITIFTPSLFLKIYNNFNLHKVLPSSLSVFVLQVLESLVKLAFVRLSLIILSILGWFFEVLAYFFLQRSFGFDSSIFGALSNCGFSAISTIIPSAPGYIGTYHFMTAQSISNLITDESILYSYSIFSHFVFIVSMSIFGLIFHILLIRNHSE